MSKYYFLALIWFFPAGLNNYEKLTIDEQELCSTIRIVPSSFLTFKSLLATENNRMGYLRLADARKLLKIDVNKTRVLYDFLLERGYINKNVWTDLIKKYYIKQKKNFFFIFPFHSTIKIIRLENKSIWCVRRWWVTTGKEVFTKYDFSKIDKDDKGRKLTKMKKLEF